MTRERWMALCFAIGSICFLVGPIGPYGQAVGPRWDGLTFFVGSVPFTLGGAIQTATAWVDRDRRRSWLLLRGAAAQSVGTIFFNLTTWRALSHVPSGRHYDVLVWRPDFIGSLAFLVSGVLVYIASPRRRGWPRRGHAGWWEPVVNLAGCAFFGISALAALAISGSLVGPRVDAWGTGLGAACFLACALGTLISAQTLKSPRLSEWEDDLEADLSRVVSAV